MKVTLFIDSLAQGGAQRQLVELANELFRRGYMVDVLVYFDFTDLQKFLIPSINVTLMESKDKYFQRTVLIRKHLRESKSKVVIAFLSTPSFLSELSGIPNRNFGLIVSERSLDSIGDMSYRRKIMLWFHRFADFIVTNSESQSKILRSYSSLLGPKIKFINNCVDLDRFSPSEDTVFCGEKLKILSLGRISKEKNYETLIKAVHIVKNKIKDLPISVDIYGATSNTYQDEQYELFLQSIVKKYQLEGIVRLNGPSDNLPEKYRASSLLCIPSVIEGFPNVVCEAMASAKPVIGSRVGDIPYLIKEDFNGYLFEPGDEIGLADCLIKYHNLESSEKDKMGRNSRLLAEELLSQKKFGDAWDQLITQSCTLN